MGRVHRPIQYRAFVKSTGQMLVVDALCFKPLLLETFQEPHIVVHDEQGEYAFTFRQVEIMQFTTNYDISGQCIFECDILEHMIGGIEHLDLIWWDGDSWRVGEFRDVPLSGFMGRVVGNRYQHPKLLERIRYARTI